MSRDPVRWARERLWALCAGVPAAAVYLLTVHPGLPGGDSGELITAAHTLGVAHPPGYPLYTLLGKLFITCVPFGSAALRLNILSAILGASAAVVLAAAVKRLARSPSAGVVAGLCFAFSSSAWKYALVAEVFALNNLMAAGLLYSLAWVLDDAGILDGGASETPGGPRPLYLAALLTGLIPAHQHTLLLLALPIGALMGGLLLLPEPAVRRALPGFRRPLTLGWSEAGKLAAVAALGLLPLLHLPLAASRVPALSWGDPSAPGGLLRLLLRMDFGTFGLLGEGWKFTSETRHGWVYLSSLPDRFAFVGAALAAAGAAGLLFRRWRALGLLSLGVVAAVCAFFWRVSVPDEPLVFRGAVERLYILPDLLVAALAGLGAKLVEERIPSGRRAFWGCFMAALTASASLSLNWDGASQRGNRFMDGLAEGILASLPERSALFVVGDAVSNALRYKTLVEGLRPDTAVVDQELMTYGWYVRGLRRRDPELLPPLGKGHRVRILNSGVLPGRVVEYDEKKPTLRFRFRGADVDVDKGLIEGVARGESFDRLILIRGGVLEGFVLDESAEGLGILIPRKYVVVPKDLIGSVEKDPDPGTMFLEEKKRRKKRRLTAGTEDRYSGLPDTQNVLWLDHLRGKRPVCFLGSKENSYRLRYAVFPWGMTSRVFHKNDVPSLESRMRTTLKLLERMGSEVYFRRQDPWSFEEANRVRYRLMMLESARLLSRREAGAFHPGRFKGYRALTDFLYRDAAINGSPESYKAVGTLLFANPHLLDWPKALRYMLQYRRSLPAGVKDEEADQVIRWLEAYARPGRWRYGIRPRM